MMLRVRYLVLYLFRAGKRAFRHKVQVSESLTVASERAIKMTVLSNLRQAYIPVMMAII